MCALVDFFVIFAKKLQIQRVNGFTQTIPNDQNLLSITKVFCNYSPNNRNINCAEM